MRAPTICAVLLLLTVAPAVQGAPVVKATKALRLLEVFDSTVERLPARFAGSDFTALFRAKSAAPKGEFETSDHYRERLKIIGGDSYYALPLDLSTKYDADHQRFGATISAQKLQGEVWLLVHSTPNAGRAIIVRETRKELGKYQGSSALGVKVKVTRVLMSQDAVVLNRSLGETVGFREMRIPVPLDRARATRLAFLLVFKPEPIEEAGLTTMATGYEAPTIDFPVEVKTTTRYIFAGDAAAWAYDKTTGEVLEKLTLATKRMPRYPGAVNLIGEHWSDSSEATTQTLATTDSGEKVLIYYHDQLTTNGFTVTTSHPRWGLRTLTADSPEWHIQITVTENNLQTMINYEEKYKEK